MRVARQGLAAGAGHNQAELRVRRVGDVALGAVQHIAVARADCRGRHRGGIRTRSRLGQPERGDITGGEARQPFGLLFGGARVLDRRADHADVDRDDRAIGRQGIAQRMDGLDILADIHSRAAVFLGHGQAEQTHLAHFGKQVSGDGVGGDDLRFRRDQPFAHIAAQLLVELGKDLRVHTGNMRCGGLRVHWDILVCRIFPKA